MRRWMILAADLLLAALLIVGIWCVNYLIPQGGIAAENGDYGNRKRRNPFFAGHYAEGVPAASCGEQRGKRLKTTKVKLDSQDWHEKFADQFTSQVVSTDTSYTSPDHFRSLDLRLLSDPIVWTGQRMEITKNTARMFPTCWRTSMWEILHVCRPVSLRTPMESDIRKN